MTHKPINDLPTPTPNQPATETTETPTLQKPLTSHECGRGRYKRTVWGSEDDCKYCRAEKAAIAGLIKSGVWAAVGYIAVGTYGVFFAVSLIFPADVIWNNAAAFWSAIL